MIAVSIIYIILGMFLDPLGMILLTIPVFVPMFAALNLDLVWFGVIVVKYIGIGLLTPPVGFNIYVVSAALDNTIPLKTIFRGCYWFLGLRGGDHDAADRLPADFALAAEHHGLGLSVGRLSDAEIRIYAANCIPAGGARPGQKSPGFVRYPNTPANCARSGDCAIIPA